MDTKPAEGMMGTEEMDCDELKDGSFDLLDIRLSVVRGGAFSDKEAIVSSELFTFSSTTDIGFMS
jgi:hypothetical protein